jgi:hypothetical protein
MSSARAFLSSSFLLDFGRFKTIRSSAFVPGVLLQMVENTNFLYGYFVPLFYSHVSYLIL